jgi:hypothetical protein
MQRDPASEAALHRVPTPACSCARRTSYAGPRRAASRRARRRAVVLDRVDGRAATRCRSWRPVEAAGPFTSGFCLHEEGPIAGLHAPGPMISRERYSEVPDGLAIERDHARQLGCFPEDLVVCGRSSRRCLYRRSRATTNNADREYAAPAHVSLGIRRDVPGSTRLADLRGSAAGGSATGAAGIGARAGFSVGFGKTRRA